LAGRGSVGLTRITLPDPALVLLVGPSGAGKTTFAEAHFRPTEIVSSDHARAMLTDDPGDQGASAEAFRIVTTLVNGRIKRRLTTVVDATNLRAANRARYRAQAARYGVPAVAICFDLPVDAYHARNVRRPDRVVDDLVVDDQAARMTDVLAALTDEGYFAIHVVTAADEAIEVVRTTR
jgi:predicted kinase